MKYHKDFDNISFLQDWANRASGWFNIRQLSRDPDDWIIFEEKFEFLADQGFIEKHLTQRGTYRRKETQTTEIDFINATDDSVDIWLPFELSDYIELFPGNICMIAGMKSAGKSCLMFNLIEQNMYNWDVDYYTSEMGGSELKKRLNLLESFSFVQY